MLNSYFSSQISSLYDYMAAFYQSRKDTGISWTLKDVPNISTMSSKHLIYAQFTSCAQGSILDVWQGSEYASDVYFLSMNIVIQCTGRDNKVNSVNRDKQNFNVVTTVNRNHVFQFLHTKHNKGKFFTFIKWKNFIN